MEGLIKAVADVFAALLSTIGFVGRPRRRAHIRDEMQLVTELAEHPDFGRGSWPHQALMNRVALDVARLAGVRISGRKFPWSTAFWTLVIGGLFGYWTFKLNQDHFQWRSLVPGVVAALMAVSLFGMIVGPQDNDVDE